MQSRKNNETENTNFSFAKRPRYAQGIYKPNNNNDANQEQEEARRFTQQIKRLKTDNPSKFEIFVRMYNAIQDNSNLIDAAIAYGYQSETHLQRNLREKFFGVCYTQLKRSVYLKQEINSLLDNKPKETHEKKRKRDENKQNELEMMASAPKQQKLAVLIPEPVYAAILVDASPAAFGLFNRSAANTTNIGNNRHPSAFGAFRRKNQ